MRLRKIPRAITTFAAVSTVLAVGACGSDGADSASGGGEDGPTPVSFFSWDDEETMGAIIDRCEEEQDITVEFSTAPPVAEYISTLQTRILSGTAADVFAIAAENKTNLIEAGAVVDLTDKPFMENIAQFNKDTYSAEDRLYGMSVSSWGAGLLYNKDLLAEVGAEAPPQTWEEFLALSQELQDAGVTPYLESLQGMPAVLSAFLGAKDDAMEGTLDDGIFDGSSSFSEEWVEPLTAYNQLWEEGLVTPDVVGLTGDQVRDEFVNGRVAMMIAGPWDLSPIRDAAPDLEFEMAPVPALPNGEPYLVGAASPGYAINSKAENPEAAERLLTCLGSPEVVEMYNEAAGAITTTTDYDPAVDPALEPVVEDIREGNVYLPQISWKRYEDILNTEAVAQLQLMVQGQATPTQVAEALDQKLQASGG